MGHLLLYNVQLALDILLSMHRALLQHSIVVQLDLLLLDQEVLVSVFVLGDSLLHLAFSLGPFGGQPPEPKCIASMFEASAPMSEKVVKPTEAPSPLQNELPRVVLKCGFGHLSWISEAK